MNRLKKGGSSVLGSWGMRGHCFRNVPLYHFTVLGVQECQIFLLLIFTYTSIKYEYLKGIIVCEILSFMSFLNQISFI